MRVVCTLLLLLAWFGLSVRVDGHQVDYLFLVAALLPWLGKKTWFWTIPILVPVVIAVARVTALPLALREILLVSGCGLLIPMVRMLALRSSKAPRGAVQPAPAIEPSTRGRHHRPEPEIVLEHSLTDDYIAELDAELADARLELGRQQLGGYYNYNA